MSQEYSIGEMARRTGVKVTTIRFYESRGLIAEPARTAGGQRRYDRAALERLGFLRHARALGFDLDDIAELMALSEAPEEDCTPAHEIAARQLAAVDARIDALKRLRKELSRVAHAHDTANGGPCRVIEALGDHAKCLGPHDPIAKA